MLSTEHISNIVYAECIKILQKLSIHHFLCQRRSIIEIVFKAITYEKLYFGGENIFTSLFFECIMSILNANAL